QQQQVGFLPGNNGQGQPRLFTAREAFDRAQCFITMKAKTAQIVAQALFRLLGTQALQVQQGAGFQIQGIQLMLGKVANGQMLALGALSGKLSGTLRQGFDQGGLAGAIGAKQTQTAAGTQVDADLSQNGLIGLIT